MLTTIRIKNFRSIAQTVYTIRPGVNVLVGSNGSGKTNILTALKFLSYVLKYGAALAMGKIGGGRQKTSGEVKKLFSLSWLAILGLGDIKELPLDSMLGGL